MQCSDSTPLLLCCAHHTTSVAVICLYLCFLLLVVKQHGWTLPMNFGPSVFQGGISCALIPISIPFWERNFCFSFCFFFPFWSLRLLNLPSPIKPKRVLLGLWWPLCGIWTTRGRGTCGIQGKLRCGGKDQGGTKDGDWAELNPNDRGLCCVNFQTTNVQVAGRILNDLPSWKERT